jgi:hypothetical protein
MNQHSLRQAAIVLGALDPQAARKLLHALPSDLARNIRRELAHLGPVSPQERLEAMEAWRAFTPMADLALPESTGEEFPAPQALQSTPSVAPFIHEQPSAVPIPRTASEEPLPSGPPQVASDTFRWKEEDLPWLAKQLTEQPPWIVSATMRLLPAHISGYLLHQLPQELVVAALERLPHSDLPHPDAARLLANGLNPVETTPQPLSDPSIANKPDSTAAIGSHPIASTPRPPAPGDVCYQQLLAFAAPEVQQSMAAVSRHAESDPLADPPLSVVPERTTIPFQPLPGHRNPGTASRLPNAGDSPHGSDATAMPLTELLSLSDPDLFQVIQASQPQDILTILQDTDSPLAPRIRSFLRRKDGKRVERYLKTVPQLGLKQDPQSLYRIGQVAQRLLERGQIATWIHQSLSTG